MAIKCLKLSTIIFLVHIAVSLWAYELQERPKDMIIGERGFVYVLDSNQIHQLHYNLSLEQTVSLVSGVDPLRMILSTNETEMIVCLSNGKCSVYDTLEWFVDGEPATVSYTSASIAVSNFQQESFYIASEQILSERNHYIKLDQYFLEYPDLCVARTVNLRVTNNTFVSRRFLHSFQFGQHMYFISVDSVNGSDVLTLMRVCGSEVDSLVCNEPNGFNAVYEIVLNCGQIGSVTGISVFGNNGTLVIGLSSINYSRHCSFDLPEINTQLDEIYETCLAGSHVIPLPWATTRDYYCSALTGHEVSPCNFGSSNSQLFVPALTASSVTIGVISKEVLDFNVSVSFPLVIDGVSLVYVGASNVTGNYLLKYHHDGIGAMILLEEHLYNEPVVLLKFNDDHLYVATEDMVYRYPVRDCSQFEHCSSCALSNNPLCGWCELENKCSDRGSCRSSNLPNRWLRSDVRCIAQVTVKDQYIAFDSSDNIEFKTSPTTTSFPVLRQNESFVCLFTDIATRLSYNWSVSGNNCISNGIGFSLFNRSSVSLSFSIVPVVDSFKSFRSNSIVTVFNCSQYERCITCQHAPPCGWCVYDHTCTGSSSLCREPDDWMTATNDDHQLQGLSCPAVFQPAKGHYLQPAGVSRKLNLTTSHVPPPIEGFKYICRVKYLGVQSVVFDVNASYTERTENELVSCQFGHDQVLLQSKSHGIEGLQLQLLYVEIDGSLEQDIDYIRDNDTGLRQFDPERRPQGPPPPTEPVPDLLLYNCSQLGTSCSSCLSLRLSEDNFPCGWCTRQQLRSESCVDEEDCHDPENSFFNTNVSGEYCPHPVVKSLFPTSGPIQGGTTVTITGTNLGVTVSDITAIAFGQVPCVLRENEYQAGSVIKCVTAEATATGSVDITVNVRMGDRMVEVRSPIQFSYLVPKINSVDPRYGPVSGGTLITIRGSSLNISDPTKTTVRLGGQDCSIQSINTTHILCLSSPNFAGMVFVQLNVDAADIVAESYTYSPDPILLRVSPANTIESGGIILTFTGHNLNSTKEPVLVVYDEDGTHTAACQAESTTALHCITPQVHTLFGANSFGKRSREGTIQRIINYTIVMDKAPGPNISLTNLMLYVRPDPAFTEIRDSDRVYVMGSGESISILGRYLGNVRAVELMVTVNDISCENVTVIQNVLECRPPLFLSDLQDDTLAEVKVTVGDGTLEYSVGSIEYKQMSITSWDTTQLLAVILGSSILVIILLVLSCALVLVCVYIRRKRVQINRIDENELADIQDEDMKLSDGEKSTSLPHENLYEDINELVFSNSGKGLSVTRQTRFDDRSDYRVSPVNGSRERTKRSLPEVPSEEYIEMGAHRIWCPQESINLTRNEELDQPNSPTTNTERSLTGGEYVDMLPSVKVKNLSGSHRSTPTYSAIDQRESILSAIDQRESILSATVDEYVSMAAYDDSAVVNALSGETI